MTTADLIQLLTFSFILALVDGFVVWLAIFSDKQIEMRGDGFYLFVFVICSLAMNVCYGVLVCSRVILLGS